MDKETHECFRVTPDQTLERLYPKLPSKPLRVKGAIYEVATGMHSQWDGKRFRLLCRDCVAKQASYPDEEGRSNKLCSGCADKVGTKIVLKPCRDCPVDAKTQASYPDEEGRSNKLCSGCADKVGTKIVRFPCRDCPANAKKESSYPDEKGKPQRLCSVCADKVGTKIVQRPCRDCPVNTKTEAHHPDEKGKPQRLCSVCADKVGTKIVLKPCRDCPVNTKKEANYPDEKGRSHKLCSVCADKVGTKIVRKPCRDCPVDAKTEAHYPDEDGRSNKLCAGCAFDAGLKPQATSGASMVACRCWHRLEKVSKAKLTHHVCCIDPTKWAGEEKKGLIPGRAFKPDAYIEPNLPIHLEGETSGPKGAVYLFHGNEWHGYPEGHPKYEEVNYCGDSYKERYHKTLAQEEMYKMEGYRVFVVWEHEYGASDKAKCPVHIQRVVREV